MNKNEVSDLLRDYHWMIREIARIRSETNEVDSAGVGQYGIESTMPKAQGDTSDPVAKEVVRRERKIKRQVKLERKVMFIQDRIYYIKDEREQTVLDCMLDGMSNAKIANHMGLSDRHIQRIKEEIIKKLSEKDLAVS